MAGNKDRHAKPDKTVQTNAYLSGNSESQITRGFWGGGGFSIANKTGGRLDRPRSADTNRCWLTPDKASAMRSLRVSLPCPAAARDPAANFR